MFPSVCTPSRTDTNYECTYCEIEKTLRGDNYRKMWKGHDALAHLAWIELDEPLDYCKDEEDEHWNFVPEIIRVAYLLRESKDLEDQHYDE